MDEVILVDSQDNQIGTMPKLKAHQEGVLHRAFSIFIFNTEGQLLLQQRSFNKYHSAGLWSNTCCSHPRPHESLIHASRRRLKEEMGIVCDLTPMFSFVYKTHFDNHLIEHEFDHVYFGIDNSQPQMNTDEVNDWKYMDVEELAQDINLHPHRYTSWLRICIPKIVNLRVQQEVV